MTEYPMQSYLLECLDYSPESGKLFWRIRPEAHFKTPANAKSWNARYSGKEAGAVDICSGYRSLSIDGRSYRAHRLIWLLLYNEAPIQVDHINGRRSDNRATNLRSVTPAENARNMRKTSRNTSGVVGVSWNSRYRKWYAAIKVNHRTTHLGCFSNIEEARAARRKAERENDFHKNHGDQP